MKLDGPDLLMNEMDGWDEGKVFGVCMCMRRRNRKQKRRRDWAEMPNRRRRRWERTRRRERKKLTNQGKERRERRESGARGNRRNGSPLTRATQASKSAGFRHFRPIFRRIESSYHSQSTSRPSLFTFHPKNHWISLWFREEHPHGCRDPFV